MKSTEHGAVPNGVHRAQEAAPYGHQPDAGYNDIYRFAESMVPDNTPMDQGNEPAQNGQGGPPGPSQPTGGQPDQTAPTAGTVRQQVTGVKAPGDGVPRAQGGALGAGACGIGAQGGAPGAAGHPAHGAGAGAGGLNVQDALPVPHVGGLSVPQPCNGPGVPANPVVGTCLL